MNVPYQTTFKTEINGVHVGAIFFENLNTFHVSIQKGSECLIDMNLDANKYPSFDAVIAHIRNLFAFLFKGKKVTCKFCYESQYAGA